MSKIDDKFKELTYKGQKALIPYIMTGFPSQRGTISTIRGLVNGGADIIELGFPFSDPLADGPTIQNAGTVSIRRGANIDEFFKTVKKASEITAARNIPLVLMTYANILHNKGYDSFVRRAKKAGIDGLIIPDIPLEESREYVDAARRHLVDTVFLVSPNTPRRRMEEIARVSTGFLYLVAVYGTTGVRTHGAKAYTIRAINRAKKACRIPLGVGFGVSSPSDVARYVRAGADAVIVGSAILKLVEQTPQKQLESSIEALIRDLKKETRVAG